MQCVPVAEPPWLAVARAELECGVKEIAGAAHHPRILAYHAVTALRATSDEVPWCSSGACWCLEQVGVVSPRSARARDWLEWGEEISFPVPGCIAVFARGKSPSQGHVGFVVGVEANGDLLVLGGNQHNAWTIESYPRHRLLSLRMPAPPEAA
jgi:uncharacterized protein (TIGR02594 family)